MAYFSEDVLIQFDKMDYFYVYMEGNEGQIVNSIKQLSELSGKSYRTVQRILERGDVYYDPSGGYWFRRMKFERDGRKNNKGNEQNLKPKV